MSWICRAILWFLCIARTAAWRRHNAYWPCRRIGHWRKIDRGQKADGVIMCELDDFEEFSRRPVDLTRRQFGAMALGAGLAAALPGVVNAAETSGADIDIETPAGIADAYFVHPTRGKHPGVLIWPDIFGLRPAFKQMATRLAASGYSVLVINPFYRTKRAPTAPEHPDFGDPATRDALLALMHSLSPATAEVDAKAFIAFLDGQTAVDTRKKLATTGYCMGGPFVMRTAALFPDRVGAGATFHGGGLVTDNPDSPHRLIPEMKAHFLIAIAENDDSTQPEAKTVLRAAFAAAHLPSEIEVYAGTKHGWCPPDSQVYDATQAERAWSRMLTLLGASIA